MPPTIPEDITDTRILDALKEAEWPEKFMPVVTVKYWDVKAHTVRVGPSMWLKRFAAIFAGGK